MNQLSTRQRKTIYVVAIVVLLAPIIYLGQPATSAGTESGGVIARERFRSRLGEASLGDVDPASTSMSLVLLGMRGMAANLLWMQADKLRDHKQWSQLEQTVESILLLQPHFQSVWKFQCWNLTYNVSAECDAVTDRFYWVKRGLIFLTRGVKRNLSIPELPHDLGDFCGKKIGRADERDFYRRFFVSDPDPEFKGGPDPAVNPNGEDNYLVARKWYQQANDVADQGVVQQHKMDGPLFYSYPPKSLMDFGAAKQQDALDAKIESMDQLFTEARQRWAEAYDEWVGVFGRREFVVPIFGKLQIDGNTAELEKYAAEDNMTLQQKIEYRDRYQNTTGYRYWKLRCEVEKTEDMSLGHKLLILGRKKYRDEQDMQGAEEALTEGLTRMERVFNAHKNDEGRSRIAADDSDMLEEVVKALLIYRQVREINGRPIGQEDDFPMKSIWNDPEFQDEITSLAEKFQRWQGGVSVK
ncbi:hypothetical protein Pan44_37940 [Caulifigura coniformis]|uniref:IRE (Iron responsive element) n=1 Tax=Caulifigura coniformis TaxID=2527983 RepID=A0A517SI09_9PLAN|nr:hypothetical protein [Caulifigura coniformis]QDT55747.1 hypothetical protein Pan44_37940 [Caulifigura coniformis]